MAEAVGLAASILGIAGVGVSITTTLYRFTQSYKLADRKVESIVTTVSVTSSILTELGNATKEHPGDLQKLNRWALFSDTIAACKRDFELIATAIGDARKRGATIQDQPKMRKDGKGKATPWQKLKWAIGEEKDVDDLLNSLERSKSNLQLLLDASNYDILRKLEKSHELNPQLAEQLTEIRAVLPWLVTNMMKLGYRPDRADVPNNHPTGTQGISSDGLKAPPEEMSESPAQEVKGEQKGSRTPEDVLTVKSNHDAGKDAPQPPNVQDPLSSLDISRDPAEEVPQDPLPEPSNHITADLPVVESKEEELPAAESYQFDRDNYESWSLTYQKAHIKREDEYQELVVITRPFKIKSTQVRKIPESYHFVKFRPPESEIKSAVLDKGATPVIEVITSLPLPAQTGMDMLLKRRKAVRPTIVKVDIVKQPLWIRLVGRRTSWPSLVVLLECTPEISNSSISSRYLADEESAASRGRRDHLNSHHRSRSVIEVVRQRSPRRRGLSPQRRSESVVEESRRNSWEGNTNRDRKHGPLASFRSSTSAASEGQALSSEEEAERIMEVFQGNTNRDRIAPFRSSTNRDRKHGPLAPFRSSTSAASEGQALPSEEEAERIMEEFLSGLTASQDGEDANLPDDAAAATVSTASKEAEQV